MRVAGRLLFAVHCIGLIAAGGWGALGKIPMPPAKIPRKVPGSPDSGGFLRAAYSKHRITMDPLVMERGLDTRGTLFGDQGGTAISGRQIDQGDMAGVSLFCVCSSNHKYWFQVC